MNLNIVSILLACMLGIAQSTTISPALTIRGGRFGKAPIVVVQAPLTEGPLQVFINTIKDSKKHLIAAGVARCVSIFTMFPVDTIKTRLQMGQQNAFAASGLYKGVGGSLFGQVPYGVLTFGSYELYKKTLLEKLPNVKPAFVYALAAICGDVTGSGWLCPSEVVKQQTQAGMYASTGDAVRGIFEKKGLAGFYQGYLGGLARDVPFRVAQLVSFEVTKNFYLRTKRKNSADDEKVNLSPIESAICGAMAGSLSAAITSPLDRIKTLLMTDSVAYGGTVGSCISKIWQDEGIAGLCQGMAPRVVYIAPSVAIFFIAYEQVQQRMSD
jgi:solute carrier family 25 S-adenosylmethionine transporter 26